MSGRGEGDKKKVQRPMGHCTFLKYSLIEVINRKKLQPKQVGCSFYISMFLGDYHLGSPTPSFLILSLPIVKSPLAAFLYSWSSTLPASSANMFDLPSTSATLSLAQLKYTLFWNVGTPVFDWLDHTAPVFETMLFVQLITLPT